METLQKLVPYYQELLQNWYQLTLDNREYAICLAVSVWLLTAIFYSIRIGFLKRSNAKLLKDNTATQTSLDETKEQLQTLQQQYTEVNERMEQAVEKAETESQHLQASNKQLANSLATMVDCFELNQHNLPTAESENLLTEYEAVVARVLERFQTEQQAKTQLQLTFHAETAKLAEKEMLVSSLQNRLDTQTQQLAKLELAIEHYEDAQRQLEADKQQLANEMQKRQAEAAQLLELEKQNLIAAHSQAKAVLAEQKSEPEPEPVVAESVQQPDTFEEVEEQKPAAPEVHPEPVQVVAKPQISEAPVAKAKPQPEKAKADAGKKMKGIFGRAMDKIAKMDEKMGSPAKETVKPEQVMDQEDSTELSPAALETPDPVKPAVVADTKKLNQDQSFNEKLSGLFGGFKKTAKPAISDAAPETTVEPEVKAEPEKTVAKPKKEASKLSGLFGKLKSKK